jgi:hypothetical protein
MVLNDTILEFQGNLHVLNYHVCNFKLVNVPLRKYLWIYISTPIIVVGSKPQLASTIVVNFVNRKTKFQKHKISIYIHKLMTS